MPEVLPCMLQMLLQNIQASNSKEIVVKSYKLLK